MNMSCHLLCNLMFWVLAVSTNSWSQSFLKTYPQAAPNAGTKLRQTATGFEIETGHYFATTLNSLPFDLYHGVMTTDANGVFGTNQNFNFQNVPELRLANGNFLQTSVNAAQNQVAWQIVTAAGAVLNSFSLSYPAGKQASAGIAAEFSDGSLFVSFFHGNPISRPPPFEKRTVVFAKINPANGQVVWQTNYLSENLVAQATPYLAAINSSNEVFVAVVESNPTNEEHSVRKVSATGQIQWGTAVSSLERTVRQMAPTPDGGVWFFYNQVLGYLAKISPGGNLNTFTPGTDAILTAGTTRDAIVATPGNGVMLMGTFGSPSKIFTVRFSATGAVVLSNDLGPLNLGSPVPRHGIRLASGEYVFTGSEEVAGVRRPFLIKLNENGAYVQPPATCTGNLLTNPGFESGLTGWNTTGDATISTAAHSGVTAAKVGGTGYGSVGIALPTTPGTSYALTAWAKTTGAATSKAVQLRFLNASYVTLPGTFTAAINSATYTELSLTGTALAGAAYIYVIAIKDGGGSIEVDDWCLTTGGAPPCAITATATAPQCNDNGTPANPADDKFTFSFTVNGSTGYWQAVYVNPDPGSNIVSINGQYGVPKTLTFSIADVNLYLNGSVYFTIFDGLNSGCTTQFSVAAPATCSNGGAGFDIAPSNLVFLPNNTASPGGGVTFTYDRAHTGTPPAGAQYSNLGYLSTDNVLSANDLSVYSQVVNPVVTGTFTQIPGFFVVPAATAPGSYFFILKSDGLNELAESNENNNVIFAPITVAGTPCSVTAVASNVTCANNQFSYTLTVSGTGVSGGWTGLTYQNGANGVHPFVISGQYGVPIQVTTYTVGTPPTILPVSDSNTSINCGTNYTLTCPGTGQIDLSLSLQQLTASPAQWNNYAVKAIISNAGPQAATGVKVKFAKPTNVVYVGGNTHTASQGSFNPNGDEVWTVGSIPAGGSATLTVNYFLLQATAPTSYAQVTAAVEMDSDSQPNNGAPPTPVQDDEASTTGGGGGGNNVCPGNLLTNGGLESGVAGWQIVPLVSGNPWSITADAHSGTKAFTGREVKLSQFVNVQPGKVYKLTYWAKATLTDQSAYIVINQFSNVGPVASGGLAYVTSSSYQQYELQFTAYVSATNIEVLAYSTGNNFITTDDFCLTEVQGGGQQPDLNLADLQIPTASIAAGAILNYNFDASNAGTLAVPGNFTIKSYISTDNVLSANDVQDGTIPTGNYGVGLVVNNVAGASTIPAGLAAGSYFLIVKIDADNAVTESNETNNVVVKPFTVTGGGTSGCNAITLTPAPGKITIAGATAPHVLIKVFKPNWTLAFECIDNCANPLVINGLNSGTHHVQVKLLNANWGEICYLQQDVSVTSFGGNTGAAALLLQDARFRLAFDKFYPNPAAHGLNIVLFSPQVQTATLDFYNQQGMKVHTMQVQLEEGGNTLELEVGDWKSGFYNVIARGYGLPGYGRFLKVWEK